MIGEIRKNSHKKRKNLLGLHRDLKQKITM